MKARELWEVRKRSKRHSLGEPQVADGTPEPPSRILGPPSTTAIPAAAAFVVPETESPCSPAAPTHVQAISTQSESVCRNGLAARADH